MRVCGATAGGHLCQLLATGRRHTKSSPRATCYRRWPSTVIMTPKVRPTELSTATLNLLLTLYTNFRFNISKTIITYHHFIH